MNDDADSLPVVELGSEPDSEAHELVATGRRWPLLVAGALVAVVIAVVAVGRGGDDSAEQSVIDEDTAADSDGQGDSGDSDDPGADPGTEASDEPVGEETDEPAADGGANADATEQVGNTDTADQVGNTDTADQIGDEEGLAGTAEGPDAIDEEDLVPLDSPGWDPLPDELSDQRLVLIDPSWEVAWELDPVSGALDPSPIEGDTPGSTRTAFATPLVGGGWTIVHYQLGGAWLLRAADQTPEPVGDSFGVVTGRRVWAAPVDDPGRGATVRYRGVGVGDEIEVSLPVFAQLSGELGDRPVASFFLTGSTHVVDEPPRRLSQRFAVAGAPGWVTSYGCDELLDCDLVVEDLEAGRAVGERIPAPADEIASGFGFGSQFVPRSPDGRALLWGASDADRELSLLAHRERGLIPVPGSWDGRAQLANEGTHALWLEGDQLVIHEVETGRQSRHRLALEPGLLLLGPDAP